MSKLAISLGLAMAQVVVQVGLILAFPAHYADTPTWVFAVYPLVVFGASLAFLVVMARKKIERQEQLR